MIKRGIIIFIIIFWGVATGWLIINEIMPEKISGFAGGYKNMFSGGMVMSDKWMQILLNGKKAGYSHTNIESHDDNAVQRYVVRNTTQLSLVVMGTIQSVSVNAEAELDALYNLQNFSFRMNSGHYKMYITGTRNNGDIFDVNIKSGNTRSKMKVVIPDDAIVYSPMVELTLKNIKPGHSVKIKTFNPITMGTESMLIKALRYEDITVNGKDYHATVLSADYQGLKILTWIDKSGNIIRQNTPFGWTMEACDAKTALKESKDIAGGNDILNKLAVPVVGEVENPRIVSSLDITLYGADAVTNTITSHRQKIIRCGTNSVEVKLYRETLPESSPSISDIPRTMEQYLKSTTYIQSDDKEIIKKARTIIGNEQNSLRAAIKICDWVNKNMEKNPAISIPSAKDILHVMSGDCNEHTYLFTAFARAVGLPAKVMVGIVYNDGKFYYHAWPAVYVGQWLEMDPTFGQHNVDATHIKLLEGELSNQMKLMGVIGKLRVRI